MERSNSGNIFPALLAAIVLSATPAAAQDPLAIDKDTVSVGTTLDVTGALKARGALQVGGAATVATTLDVTGDLKTSGILRVNNGQIQLHPLGVHTIGVQSYTTYFRTGPDSQHGFAWYSGGAHDSKRLDPGGGMTLMTLTREGGLTISNPGFWRPLTVRSGGDNADYFVAGTLNGRATIGAHGTPVRWTNLVINGDFNSGSSGNVLFPGRIGVGTLTPTQGKLVVIGSEPYNLTIKLAFTQVTKTIDTSIYASNAVLSAENLAFSDSRIKRVEGRSDSVRDLRTLMGIEITDFHYKDVIGLGDTPHKMVIGQQVEQVFPQAVTRRTDAIPDIYQRAPLRDGWIELATDLQKGDRVRLIAGQNQGVYEVLETGPDRFRTEFHSREDQVFVYGREVNDFRTVDYEAIAMLNVSATQEIEKRTEAELQALRAANAELKARLQALDAKLASIEKLLRTSAEVTGGNPNQ